MTLENRTPIKTYIWTHNELDELLSDLDKKEYLVSNFCFQNQWFYDKQILLEVDSNRCILQFEVYSI